MNVGRDTTHTEERCTIVIEDGMEDGDDRRECEMSAAELPVPIITTRLL